MRKHAIVVKECADIEALWYEILCECTGTHLQVTDEMELIPRLCYALMSDEQATTLRQHPMVESVELAFEERDDIRIAPCRIIQSRNNFTQDNDVASDSVNWGLPRHSSQYNIYGTGSTPSIPYNYDRDGSGVDIVVIDSGIEKQHPEFKNDRGQSRVVEINWGQYLTPSQTAAQSAFNYTDNDGHGTAVASVAAGRTYGWAKNANIYSIVLQGLDPTNPSKGYTDSQLFTILTQWLNQKNQSSGSNPTVINMSFAAIFDSVGRTVTGGKWRPNTAQEQNIPAGSWQQSTYGLNTYRYNDGFTNFPIRSSSLDQNVQALINLGAHVCIAANNFGMKVAISGNIDYDNYVDYTPASLGGNTRLYYMRGSSPWSSNALIVGSLDDAAYSTTTDQKADFSSAGPGVNIFAAGRNIKCAISNNIGPVKVKANYYWNAPGQTWQQTLISGTSFACPQVAGMSALYLQNNRPATVSQNKTWLLSNGTYTMYKTNDAQQDDYSDPRSQWGGDAVVSYVPVQGPGVKINSSTWQPIANIWYKDPATQSWNQKARSMWVKTNSNTWTQVF